MYSTMPITLPTVCTTISLTWPAWACASTSVRGNSGSTGTGKRTLESLLCVLIFLSVVRLDGGQRRLDVTNFVVMGEGLAAGMADFSLKDVYQEKSFPAQMAQQMNTAFPQPLI